jgi:hypothetical protein
MGLDWLRPRRLYANRQCCSTCSLLTHHLAEEQHDGSVFIGSVNFDRGPSCAERRASAAAGSGSDAGADAEGSQLHALVRPCRMGVYLTRASFTVLLH